MFVATGALESAIKGVDQDRVEIVREKPPVDIDIRKILPLRMPSQEREPEYLTPADALGMTRNLGLTAKDVADSLKNVLPLRPGVR